MSYIVVSLDSIETLGKVTHAFVSSHCYGVRNSLLDLHNAKSFGQLSVSGK